MPAINTDLSVWLDGIDFPADRATIRKFAEGNEADSAFLNAIDGLPDQFYDDIEDVASSMNPDVDMDSNEEPAHLSSQAADPGEFRASTLESKRSLEDGRDD